MFEPRGPHSFVELVLRAVKIILSSVWNLPDFIWGRARLTRSVSAGCINTLNKRDVCEDSWSRRIKSGKLQPRNCSRIRLTSSTRNSSTFNLAATLTFPFRPDIVCPYFSEEILFSKQSRNRGHKYP